MFNPSQEDVRRFFCAVFKKMQVGTPMEATETLTSLWINEHPEYFVDLRDVRVAIKKNYNEVGEGKSNPFLHLSMHISISEQCSINQPAGIRQAIELLAKKLGSVHLAHHAAMDCLQEMLWQSQMQKTVPDGFAYVACVQRKATRI